MLSYLRRTFGGGHPDPGSEAESAPDSGLQDDDVGIIAGVGLYCDVCMSPIKREPYMECLTCAGYHICTACKETDRDSNLDAEEHHATDHHIVLNAVHPSVVAKAIYEEPHWRGKLTKMFEGYMHRPCIGTFDHARSGNEIHWEPFAEVGLRANTFADGLRELGVPDGARILLAARNCAEWIVSDLGCVLGGFTSIAVAPPKTVADCIHICKASSPNVVISHVGSLALWDTAMMAAENGPVLCIAIGSRPGSGFGKWIEWDRVRVKAAPKSELEDEVHPHAQQPDLFTVMFSSGSTGMPKGVPITFDSWYDRIGMTKLVGGSWSADRLVWVSHAPLSHGLDRVSVWTTMIRGGSIVIASGDPATLFAELKAARPTKLACVPRFWGVVYQMFVDYLQKRQK